MYEVSVTNVSGQLIKSCRSGHIMPWFSKFMIHYLMKTTFTLNFIAMEFRFFSMFFKQRIVFKKLLLSGLGRNR